MIDEVEGLKALLSPPFFGGFGDLIYVTFTRYTVTLMFERGKSNILVASACEICCPSGDVWTWEPERLGDMIGDMRGFGRLLEAKIRKHEVLPGVRLRLTFSNGCRLLLCKHDSGHESFIIDKKEGPGAAYIVV